MPNNLKREFRITFGTNSGKGLEEFSEKVIVLYKQGESFCKNCQSAHPESVDLFHRS